MAGGLPSMWRVELIHPMVVHFPIVLLAAGTLAWSIGQLVGETSRFRFLLPAGRVSLVVGVMTAWLAVYTGSLADAKVVRSLCDPTVVESHENLAFLVCYIFSGGVLADLATMRFDWPTRWRRAATLIVGAALVAGSATLFYVGHLGASLVYQQGAGVYETSDACTEFE